ncbi:hypothetical protein HanRHA438_Chr08g0351931 [Helianthus annuus]|nr:hypothetical protein HanRHA438_Chr08g0351931 [Helianthus annuus]
MILDGAFIVVQKFNPSSLTHIQILLLKNMLETPVTGVNRAPGTVQVVSPYLKRENNSSQL